MDLGDVYNNNVSKKTITNNGLSTSIPASRERDPNLIKLENDIFSQMGKVIQDNRPEESKIQNTSNNIEVKHISFEDAIKELRDIS
mgnify:CR=1 FL=1|jgi:hypothetical protein|tara:strand:+ start:1727 stop:1984 length:258 start_codon:yes stop_codon:yes gene_type:complete